MWWHTRRNQFRLSAKRTSPLKSAGSSVHSTTGSRGVRISCSNAGYTMFRGSVKGNGYPLHSPVSPSLPLPCVTVCHHISTGLYLWFSHHRRSWLNSSTDEFGSASVCQSNTLPSPRTNIPRLVHIRRDQWRTQNGEEGGGRCRDAPPQSVKTEIKKYKGLVDTIMWNVIRDLPFSRSQLFQSADV